MGGTFNLNESCEYLVRFLYDVEGFVPALVTPTHAYIVFNHVSANILHQWTMLKPHHLLLRLKIIALTFQLQHPFYLKDIYDEF